MPSIVLSSFLGENRAAEAKLIPEGQGAVSLNQKPGRGDLRPWREPAQVFAAPAGTQTIYRMGRDAPSDERYWLAWPKLVHAAMGFDIEDVSERTVYSGDGYPKVTDNLALSAANPSVNPVAHRPLGVPAPARAPAVSVSEAEVDPDVGKYRVAYPEANVRASALGVRCVARVKGLPDQSFTIGTPGGPEMTPEAFAATFDALDGLRAYVAGSDDEQIPGGVWVIADAVGVPFNVAAVAGSKTDYDPGSTSLSDLLSAVGGTGGSDGGATLYSVNAVTASIYSLFVPEAALATLQAGDTLAGLVSGVQRWSVKLTGNSKSSIVAALMAAGVSASDQVYVPESYNPETSTSTGQASGVWMVMGATTTGQSIVIKRNPPRAAALVVGRDWLGTNAAPGDRWQVAVNAAAPVSITLTAGAGTYPPVVTAASLRSALAPVPGLKLTDEVDAGGAPQLRIETTEAGAGSAIAIKKIVPATADVYHEALVATLYTGKKRVVEDYFYVYTYVNDWGWESAPSPVSAVVERTVKETVTLSDFAAPPTGGYGINRIRVYRTQAGSTGDADFFFLLEAAWPASTAMDANQDLGEVLPSKTWLTAPGVPRGGGDDHVEEPLRCLTPMWNGMLAGITGKSVRFCEAYTPYAWPIAYDAVPADATPVGLGVYGQNMLILTTGNPLLVTGSSPELLDQVPLEVPQGCIAPRSIVGMGAGVAWASNDGLCWFGAGGPRILTAGLLLREDWLKMRPHTLIGQMYEGLYFGSYEPEPGQPRKGFLIDPAGGAGIFFLEEGFDAAHFDKLQDQLYVLRGTRIMKWEGAQALMRATFRSKVFRVPRPVSFAAAEVVASTYPLTLTVWADGEQVFEDAVEGRDVFRLPADFLASDWQVQVSLEDGGVQRVVLATSTQEIAEL
jgi:hypothetical protein